MLKKKKKKHLWHRETFQMSVEESELYLCSEKFTDIIYMVLNIKCESLVEVNQWYFLWIPLQMSVVTFCHLLWYYIIRSEYLFLFRFNLEKYNVFLPHPVDARHHLNQLNAAKTLLHTLGSCRHQSVFQQCHLFCNI